MKVQVTQKNIDDGICGNKCFCPIALAIRSQDKNRYGVNVNSNNGYYFNVAGGKAKRFKLPSEAQLFIAKFDNEDTVEPFEFELEMLE